MLHAPPVADMNGPASDKCLRRDSKPTHRPGLSNLLDNEFEKLVAKEEAIGRQWRGSFSIAQGFLASNNRLIHLHFLAIRSARICQPPSSEHRSLHSAGSREQQVISTKSKQSMRASLCG
jgi:hypothetical protein